MTLKIKVKLVKLIKRKEKQDEQFNPNGK